MRAFTEPHRRSLCICTGEMQSLAVELLIMFCANRYAGGIESRLGFVGVMGVLRGATSKERGRFALFGCLLANILALAATSVTAAPLPCQENYALGTTNAGSDSELVRSPCGANPNGEGALRYRDKLGSFNGFAEPRVVIIESVSPPLCLRFQEESLKKLLNDREMPPPGTWKFFSCSGNEKGPSLRLP
jgi:hypothetical protein